jgi:hypothetical protein
MKKIILTTLVHFIALSLFAQNPEWCGTKADDEFKAYYASLPNSYFQSANAGRAATLYVPVFYHLIGTVTNGKQTGTMRLSEVLQSHCDLNAAFASSDIQFYIAGIDSIFNASYYNFANNSVGNTIMNAYNKTNTCNIYINENPGGVCGYAFFPGSGPKGGGIFVNKNCYGTGSSTLIHEMGHYCALPHTFDDWRGKEFVNGSNCATAGDRFCDTPADFLDYRWTCPFVGNDVDPNGDLYKTVIDGTLYMSYSNDNCQQRFSDAQRTYMYNALKNQRAALVNNGFTGFEAMSTPNFIQPILNDSSVSPNAAFFKWNAVPGAQFYYFQIPSNVPTIVYADTVVRDTFVTIRGLFANRAYQYRVMPWGYNVACGEFSANEPFKTSRTSLGITITNRTCLGTTDGAAKLTVPNTITNPYLIEWSSGSNDDTIFGLASGEYTVTVTDGNGQATTAGVVIAAYPDFQTYFNVANNKINAQTFGGVPPFEYLWSDGSIDPSTLDATYGNNYSVTVTDSKGCTKVYNYQYNSLSDLAKENSFANIYPNPAKGFVSIEVETEKFDNGKIQIMDMTGKIVLSSQIELTQGKNNHSINLQNISQGIYSIAITASDKKWTGKLVIAQ